MSNKKTTILSSLGAGLEYYDFVIYGLLAHYISQLFFASSNPSSSILETFSIFALGYLARPIGGLLFGHFGDRMGRKNIFLISLIIMALATFMIGLLPTYHHIGIIAPVCLVIFRILQGLAFGADLPGTITFLVEHNTKNNRSIHCSFALASVSLGAALGSLIIFLLTQFLSSQQMLSFGWRIPFCFGGTLAIVSYFMRKKLLETPVFMHYKHHEYKEDNIPLLILIKKYPKAILTGISISILAACIILFNIALPTYLQQSYHYQAHIIYFNITIGLIWCVCILPFFGWLSDKIGNTAQLTWTASIIILLGLLSFKILALNNYWALLAFIMIYQIIPAALITSSLPMLTELFPTAVRFSGVAFCYNISYSLASFVPMLITKFANLANGIYCIYLFFVFISFITLIGTLFIKRNQVSPKVFA